MGFTLIPIDESVEAVSINFWNWRPTAELIGTFGIVDDERLELMQIQCCGPEITADEAAKIAERIENDVLSTLPPSGRVTLDLSVTTEPDDFVFHKGDDVHKNYSATEKWLRRFVVFCRTSGGFSVL
jgi:hypothetical protein